MFIRHTTTRNKKDGERYETYRLVENYRTEKGVRQRTLLHLGSDLPLPKEKWAELSQCIDELVSGKQSLLPYDDNITELAQKYASKIIAQQSATVEEEPVWEAIDTNSITNTSPRSVGGEQVMLEAAKALKLDSFLRQKGFSQQNVTAILGQVIARALHPGSERATHQWLQQDSALGELLDYDYKGISLDRLYRCADGLLAKKTELEKHLYQQERDLFGLNSTITLYDLTNTYFEGQCKSNNKARYGRSKEKRSDCPLVTLALVLDGSGFIQRSEIFEGNISEAKTLASMLERLQQGNPGLKQKPAIVMDAGIATQENITYLQENDWHYLVVSRKRHLEFDREQAVVVKEGRSGKVMVQRIEKDDEVELYCHSELREKKEQAIKGKTRQRFEDDLDYLKQGLHKKHRMKRKDKIIEKIGRLKQQYARVSGRYHIDIKSDGKDKNITDITWTYQPKEATTDSLPGVYCLRTSIREWDEEKLWRTYTMLTELESVFRSLKSELGLRPVYHQGTERVTAHLFISVLAYHLVHYVRYKLKGNNVHYSWNTLRNALLKQIRITTTMRCKNGSTLHIRQSTQAEGLVKKIYSLLQLKTHPGGRQKTYVT